MGTKKTQKENNTGRACVTCVNEAVAIVNYETVYTVRFQCSKRVEYKTLTIW
jgi:hypothetical protein